MVESACVVRVTRACWCAHVRMGGSSVVVVVVIVVTVVVLEAIDVVVWSLLLTGREGLCRVL